MGHGSEGSAQSALIGEGEQRAQEAPGRSAALEQGGILENVLQNTWEGSGTAAEGRPDALQAFVLGAIGLPVARG